MLLGSVEPFAAEGGAPSRLRTLPSCRQEYRTMLDPVNEVGGHVGARLLDFFDARSPWNRRLWNVGLSLTLREVLEAAEAASSGELSPRSLNFLAELAQRMVGTDPAAGMDEEKRLLQGALRAKLLRPGGLDYQVVAQQEERVRTAYLSAWANALREPQPPGAERTARAIASHLLDMGYSSDFLHRWWKYRIWHESGDCSLADIVEEAHQLTRQPTRSFDVMVPVLRAIRATGTPPAEWRPPQQVSAWLRDNGFGVSGVRQDGGFLFRIEARDPEAAVGRVSEVLDQVTARVAIGTKGGFTLFRRAWIRGETEPYRLDRAKRGVWVEALERENELYDTDSTGRVHAAVELLSHLQSSSPGAAVAGGWAAIEALLSEPDDRAGAADRLAMLVACSYPRAELTTLSYDLSRAGGGLAGRLGGLDENRRRCDIVADAVLRREIDVAGLSPSVRAAVSRVSRLLDESRRTLGLVRDHAANAFHRLYRQRNMVLHGGRTDAVALRASLRTAAPLVGAGMDRIVHALYAERLTPLPLVARAKRALATIQTSAGSRITALLAPDKT